MRAVIAWAVIILFILGTVIYWVIPWSDVAFSSRLFGYLAFVTTIVGFGATIYQLRETEIAVRESQEKPRLELEILAPAKSKYDNYASKPVHALGLHPLGGSEDKIGTTFAVRIRNTGKATASHIWLTFLVQRRGLEGKAKIGKLDLTYDEAEQRYRNQAEYFDYDVRPDFECTAPRRCGLTFHYGENLVIHNDPYVHPVVAEISIEMAAGDFEAEYELRYRIQSYEGNEALDEINRGSDGKAYSLIYPLRFYPETSEEPVRN
jgi:hypothetical protein